MHQKSLKASERTPLAQRLRYVLIVNRKLKKAVQQGRNERRCEACASHVEPLSIERTKLANFFSILLGGRAVDHQSLGFMREHSLARIRDREPNGDVILEQTQPDPPLVAVSWLPERQRHGSPSSARPGAAAPSPIKGVCGKGLVLCFAVR